ncbi:hypothetical protein [Sphingomonas sp.]|uniref:hypothetical protein n=1 Tax=Sphingomonas sp. TaxID=28214 RepID=UPI0028AE3493|nr:hypothetical protein [Sphingomonas sp.]
MSELAAPEPERARPVAESAPLSPQPHAIVAPFKVEVVSAHVVFSAKTVAFDLEIDLINQHMRVAEGLRPALALISASPDQDRWRAAFHAGPSTQNEGKPVDLAAGATLRLPVRLTLHREQLHVVVHGGRPMFVAMLLCDLRWRGGLSLHHFAADFLLGTAGQGTLPGPIWLDRAAPSTVAAIDYAPLGP